LIGNHAFVDGNKRTAITAVGLLLWRNGYRLTASNRQVVAFTLQCAQERVPLDEIALWLKEHCEKSP
jgi:death on curing protein